MTLDRALIKSQAKEIIRGKVLQLFLLCLIVSALVSGFTVFTSAKSSAENFRRIGENPTVLTPFSFASGSYTEEEFEKYFEEWAEEADRSENSSVFPFRIKVKSNLISLLQFIMMPLSIALCAIFLKLIKGEEMPLGEGIKYLFTSTFDKNYFSKLLMLFLKLVFTFLWALLFFIPGVVYAYKVYFAAYIMADRPDIGWREALELSKKITKGHKGELFILDLSFIGWYLLCAFTLGIATIYVMPYINAVQALYYENFKQRALQEGAVTYMDFMNDIERAQFNQNTYYTPPTAQNGYTAPQQGYSVPQQGYSVPQQGYSVPQQGYNVPQQNGYTAPSAQQKPDDTLPPYYYNGQ